MCDINNFTSIKSRFAYSNELLAENNFSCVCVLSNLFVTHVSYLTVFHVKLLRIPALQHLMCLLEHNQAVISALQWLVQCCYNYCDFVGDRL